MPGDRLLTAKGTTVTVGTLAWSTAHQHRLQPHPHITFYRQG
jgi:hypothetical protein